MFFFVVSTMMLPGAVTMIPLYVFFSRLHWVGSLKPLIIPTYFGNAYYAS